MEYGHVFPGCLPPSEPFHLVGSRGKDVRAAEVGKGMKGGKAIRKYVVHKWTLSPHTGRHSLVELMRGELLAFSCLLIFSPALCTVPFLTRDIQLSTLSLEGFGGLV